MKTNHHAQPTLMLDFLSVFTRSLTSQYFYRRSREDCNYHGTVDGRGLLKHRLSAVFLSDRDELPLDLSKRYIFKPCTKNGALV